MQIVFWVGSVADAALCAFLMVESIQHGGGWILGLLAYLVFWSWFIKWAGHQVLLGLTTHVVGGLIVAVGYIAFGFWGAIVGFALAVVALELLPRFVLDTVPSGLESLWRAGRNVFTTWDREDTIVILIVLVFALSVGGMH